SEGRMTGYVNVVLDVTKSKKADEELRKLSLIARSTDNAVIITDRQGKIEWVNDAFTKITEYEFQEVIGKTKGEILDGSQTHRKKIDQMAESAKDKPFQYEILNYTRSGKPFWVEVRHQPMYDSEGNVTHYFDLGTDITARKQAYEKLVNSEIEIRSFARQLNSVLEEERARIAREIHDEFGQQLTGLKLSLASLKIPGIDAAAVIDSMLDKMDETIQFLKRFSTELRPGILDTLGLFPSIEWLVDDFEKKTGIHCSLKSERQDGQPLDKEIAICCFRICQEALTNVVKHAGATSVSVELVQIPNKLLLRITDNGKGIKRGRINNPFSLGLLGMRERASLVGGNLVINSSDTGTTVDLVIDIPVISGKSIKTAGAT
ncbi:MAG TPA: PAS domain S-box protein, partial [Sphingobacteriaceae bacterium]